MTTKKCGCSTESCGCCEGIEKLTPAPVWNQPAAPTLSYRVGTHGSFFSTMKARLSTMTVEARSPDGKSLETLRPLTKLRTRESSDPAIALLDGWAKIADVLTFYQERIANEGYLRTATERRSVIELARLLGYTLRPGVAASVYLAYTLDDKQIEPVEIPAGARSQSVPGPGELPQTFETSENLVARSQWNNLQVRRTAPLDIRSDNVLELETLYVAGTNLNLKAGDTLLFVFAAQKAVRTIAETDVQSAEQRTFVRLTPLPAGTFAARDAFKKAMEAVGAAHSHDADAVQRLKQLGTNIVLGLGIPPHDWPAALEQGSEIRQVLFEALQLVPGADGKAVPAATTSPDEFVAALLQATKVQPAGSLNLPRSPDSMLGQGSDALPQLLTSFAPQLKDSYYTAWSKAIVNSAVPTLKGLYVLRAKTSLFGANAPKITREPSKQNNFEFDTLPLDQATEWGLQADETADSLFLEQAVEAVAPDSFAVIQTRRSPDAQFKRIAVSITAVLNTQRSAYGISGKTTRLQFAEAWRPELKPASNLTLGDYRETLVYCQSEPLTLAPSPLLEDVAGSELELAELYDGIVSGRWIILSGERADIPKVSGVQASELLMISGLRQDFHSKFARSPMQDTLPDGTGGFVAQEPALPGDKTHTTLVLATSMAYRYKRDTVRISANVVKATHGETRVETLGNGDARTPFQAFSLKQPPLTFIPAPTPEGVESTLKVYVNDIRWHEAGTLTGVGPNDRNFITKTDDTDTTTVIFGNGKEGSRLPTGVENVKAIYRAGLGKPGNVTPDKISLLQDKPLGVKAVTNPLRASGGADRESRDQARENAPLAVAALDHLVGVQDYIDFTRTFAGIGKAYARKVSDGSRQLVHVTIAGADDIPIDRSSDLYRNLVTALRRYGDESLPIRLESRELKVLVLSARIRIDPDYLWEKVAAAVRATLLEVFGFQKRSLGQPALLCEVISAVQNVAGVAYVDVDAFGGIPEKTAELDKSKWAITGRRRLLTLAELRAAVEEIIQPKTNLGAAAPMSDRVDANLADFENFTLRPAQLAIFNPDVPDTLILNQIP